jgi:hypothetical protein
MTPSILFKSFHRIFPQNSDRRNINNCEGIKEFPRAAFPSGRDFEIELVNSGKQQQNCSIFFENKNTKINQFPTLQF